MKKYMLLMTVGLMALSFSVVSANNASPTEKKHKNDLIIDTNYDYSDALVIKSVDYNNVAVLENSYIAFENAIGLLGYKMGSLKNKVNNFHMFYRVKLC